MHTLRRLAPLAMLAVISTDVYAAEPPVAEHHYPHAGMPAHDGVHFLLAHLDLTPEQRDQVKAVYALHRSELQSLLNTSRSMHRQLVTTPPPDPNYSSLVATAKANATAMIQLRSDEWSQIYALLTPAQQAKIPEVLAAHRHARLAHLPQT